MAVDQHLSPADLHILMAEPSGVQRRIISNELYASQIQMIDEADSVATTLLQAQRNTPDLIISALHFADGSAMDLLHQLRADTQTAEIPFMLISSETRQQQLEQFKQSGVIAILPKPFKPDDLTTAIRATLDLLTQSELSLEYYEPDQLRVLIVDDSNMARKLIRRVLSGLGIENFTEAEDGSAAMTELTEKEFDLVVTDYNMPQVNGLELTEFIRSSAQHAHLPILMVSSEANQAHLQNISRAGVNALTDKPFEPDTIRQILTRILG
ncbi:response regulator [Pontibacter sp. JAM-7]|uniref:response regulator n=1 Tax=Pontibacter sp. JAM-7 TaxID=3366581 RepID=UPI003AF4ABA7